MSKKNNDGSQATSEKKELNTRKLKYGSLAAAVTAIFTAAIILLNILAVQLTGRFGLKLDMTKEQLFEVSQETIDYLQTLKEDIDMAVMADKETLDGGSIYYKLVKEVTEKYAASSDRIKLHFYDPDKNPEVLSKYKQYYSESINAGDVVINCGERIKVIPMQSLYQISYDQQTGAQKITGITAEQELTSAILFVADPNPPTIALLTCQSSDVVSTALSELKTILEKNGYNVKTVDPLTEEISTEYAMVILPAPYNDLAETVIDKLDKYLYNDGKLGTNLFYLANVDQRDTPNINTFLEDWGIKVEPGYVVNTDTASMVEAKIWGMQGKYPVSIANIAAEDYQSLIKSKSPIVSPYPRSLTLLFDKNDDRETVAILKSPDTSIITDGTQTQDDLDNIPQAAYNVLVLGSKHIYEGDQQVSSNVLVSGSALMLDAAITSISSYGNQEFSINLINKFTKKAEGITILAKSMEIETIDITKKTANGITNVVVIIIPLLIAAAGFVVFIRRRNR